MTVIESKSGKYTAELKRLWNAMRGIEWKVNFEPGMAWVVATTRAEAARRIWLWTNSSEG